MAEILPFIGTRYNSQLIGNLSKVLSPPYDVITPELQNDLHERHPNNVVRLELSKPEPGDDGFSNKYTRAANTFRTWRSDGVLIEDETPAFYLYEQEFKLPTGETKKRRGFYALVKLEDYENGGIRAHEQTFAGPKADRLKLMRETNANFSPIFVIYNDAEQEVAKLLSEKMSEKPWEEAADDEGVVHRLWVVQRKDFIVKLRELIKARRLFIADGHHRYETALEFRDEKREDGGKADGKQPYDYMMMYLTNAEQDGIVILPTHRALSREFCKNEVNLQDALDELKESFITKEEKIDLGKPEEGKKVLQKVEKLGADGNHAFAMVQGDGKVTYLQLKKDMDLADLIDNDEIPEAVKRCDVSVLHHYIINQVFVGNPEFELEDEDCYYLRDVTCVLNLLKNKKASLGFIMNPTPMEQVLEIVSQGIKMPHKSTYFHPKIITGLVLRNMDIEMKKTKAKPLAKR